MKLGMQVGLSPGHIVLDGDPAPLPKKGTEPPFSAHVCAKWLHGLRCHLVWRYSLGPSDFVLDGNPTPLPKKGHSPLTLGPCLLWPNGCMYQDTTWYEGRPQPRRHCVRGGASCPQMKGHSPTNFWSMSIVAKRLDGSRRHLVRR